MKMFQEKLCATRKKSNKSQKEFAELVEVSSKTIYRWGKGSSSPSIAQREYLSTKLNLPVKYFYDGIDVDITTGIILAETSDEKVLNLETPTVPVKVDLFYRRWKLTVLACLSALVLGILLTYFISLVLFFPNRHYYYNISYSFCFTEFMIYLGGLVIICLLPVVIHITLQHVNSKREKK